MGEHKYSSSSHLEDTAAYASCTACARCRTRVAAAPPALLKLAKVPLPTIGSACGGTTSTAPINTPDALIDVWRTPTE